MKASHPWPEEFAAPVHIIAGGETLTIHPQAEAEAEAAFRRKLRKVQIQLRRPADAQQARFAEAEAEAVSERRRREELELQSLRQRRRLITLELLAKKKAKDKETRANVCRDRIKEFDEWTKPALDFLGLPPATRGTHMQKLGNGNACDPINKGLDVLECRGERLEEIAAWRNRKDAKRLANGPQWHLSPWQRDATTLNDRYAPWVARLKASGWKAPPSDPLTSGP